MGAFVFKQLYKSAGLNINSEDMKQITPTYSLAYPRYLNRRKFLRVLGRVLIRLLTRTKVEGLENIPDSGPVILAGNHAAYLEPILMAVLPKRIVEPIGAGDLPFEGGVSSIVSFYGFIAVNRGNLDRKAMEQAMDVLRQGGVIGIFPEGGTWAPGRMAPQIGVALLSQRTGAVVVPIGFSGLQSSLKRALQLKRPKLVMKVGKPIPAMPADGSGIDKNRLIAYSQQVLDAIYDQVTDEEKSLFPLESRYSLWIERAGEDNEELLGGSALANFLHSPVLLDSFKINLKVPVNPLYEHKKSVKASSIHHSLQAILTYLKLNPAFFTYRMGVEEGSQVEVGIRSLIELLERAEREGKPFSLHTQEILTYSDGRQEINKKLFQIEPGV